MKRTQPALLLHPLFLLSLVLLLLNDFYFKYQFHNWFTGKLSDFTGLFIFTIFLIALLPSEKKNIIVISGLFFCWWKSPLSDYFIEFFNYYLSLPVKRVIDYTDLYALLVLPFAYQVKPPNYSVTLMRTGAVYAIGIFSLFSFCATSMPRHLMYYSYRENEIRLDESFASPLTEPEILKKLGVNGNDYKKDSIRFYRVTQYENFYYRVKDHDDSTQKWIPVSNSADSSLFIRKVSPAFFVIPQYVLANDTLYNLELHLYSTGRKKKPTGIQIESFITKRPSAYNDFYYSKKRKKYIKHFKTLFK